MVKEYDFGVDSFEDMYTLLNFTAYITHKFGMSPLELYKNLDKNYTKVSLQYYIKLDAMIKTMVQMSTHSNNYNTFGKTDKEILETIQQILKNMLPF